MGFLSSKLNVLLPLTPSTPIPSTTSIPPSPTISPSISNPPTTNIPPTTHTNNSGYRGEGMIMAREC